MNNVSGFPAIVERLKLVQGLKTDAQLAQFLGLSPTSLSNRKRQGAIPFHEICTSCASSNVNIDWVLTGRGSPSTSGDKMVEPVAEVDPALFVQITGGVWLAFEGEDFKTEQQELLMKAVVRSGLAARIFNRVAFVKAEQVRSAMIKKEALEMAAVAKLLDGDTSREEGQS